MDVGGALYSGTLFQDYISVRSYIYIGAYIGTYIGTYIKKEARLQFNKLYM